MILRTIIYTEVIEKQKWMPEIQMGEATAN
jgi:hypothetical protein